MKKLLLISFLMGCLALSWAQLIPDPGMNIPFFATSGANSPASWGDDDHCQVFFFRVPGKRKKPFYIRVHDPDIGGKHDERKGDQFNTSTEFVVMGGKGAWSETGHCQEDIENNYASDYRAGNYLASREFGNEKLFDGKWYTFGPFNPSDGEFSKEWNDSYLFKMIVRGTKGDDVNLYEFFLSSSDSMNVPIDGGNAFTYEITFRLPDHSYPKNQSAKLFPFIRKKVTSIEVHNFDSDEIEMSLASGSRQPEMIKPSPENGWKSTPFSIFEGERGKVLEIEIYPGRDMPSNNLVMYILHQMGYAAPFICGPLGLDGDPSISWPTEGGTGEDHPLGGSRNDSGGNPLKIDTGDPGGGGKGLKIISR